MEQYGRTVEHCGGAVEQYGGTVEQYGGTVEHCGGTVRKRMVEQGTVWWNHVEQCGSVAQ